MIGLLCFVVAVLASPFKSKIRLEAGRSAIPQGPFPRRALQAIQITWLSNRRRIGTWNRNRT